MHLKFIMRHVLILLFSLFVANSYGQEIELQGRYGASFIGAESINFVGKDSFYFSGFYCTHGVYGKGVCEIRNEKLYLYFEKSKAKKTIEPKKAPIIQKIFSHDSVQIVNITCLDNNSLPIPFATVQLNRKNKTIIGTITDTAGQASFKIEKNEIPIKIITSSIGFNGRQIIIDSLSSYEIKIIHTKNEMLDKELNNGETYVYEIEELMEDLILMRPENSRERFRKYRKEL
jgi:hypothetical protein